ncbi:DUF1499 domain-containing protein [Lyngbya confervoides]|uniref:DUF1499 domain-containing protein n=1 Tax=Lyngbya confervoides BDU141951 TaxID=1574623 RepID=A0ABD4SYW5_9CYAN|nr:DUF1499 domain-containing protein [Lyngbya confervoides]MCM1981341.1 DUF1499 domain-containing protein [Lyngbya confervoides BDU141951]
MLQRCFCLLISALCTLGILWVNPSPAHAFPADHPSIPMALPGLQGLFAGDSPTNLGVDHGQLAPCPASPNCISSQSRDPEHYIEPIAYQGDNQAAKSVLLDVLSVVPRTRIIEQGDRYVRVEFTTALMGFVDDGEFYFPDNENLIHLRSASRLGESDLGLNRRRMEQIRLAMRDLGV